MPLAAKLGLSEGIPTQVLPLHSLRQDNPYDARVGGTKNNTNNLIVRQYVYLMVMFWYFFTYNEFDRNTQPQQNTTNITTMVVEMMNPLRPRGGRPCAYTAQGRSWRIFWFNKLI